MFAAEERGEVPEGTAQRWADHTKNIKDLPEKKKHKKTAMIKHAALLAAVLTLNQQKRAQYIQTPEENPNWLDEQTAAREKANAESFAAGPTPYELSAYQAAKARQPAAQPTPAPAFVQKTPPPPAPAAKPASGPSTWMNTAANYVGKGLKSSLTAAGRFGQQMAQQFAPKTPPVAGAVAGAKPVGP